MKVKLESSWLFYYFLSAASVWTVSIFRSSLKFVGFETPNTVNCLSAMSLLFTGDRMNVSVCVNVFVCMNVSVCVNMFVCTCLFVWMCLFVWTCPFLSRWRAIAMWCLQRQRIWNVSGVERRVIWSDPVRRGAGRSSRLPLPAPHLQPPQAAWSGWWIGSAHSPA